MHVVYTRLVVFCSLLMSCVMCLPARWRTVSKCDRSVDVAIIGAGPAGSYFAYRLRDAGLNIELFEYSNRIGGRLFTTTLPRLPDVNVELGGMRFIDGEHVRLQRLVKELYLTPTELFEGVKTKRSKYFLRGKILTSDDVSHGEVPYKLSPEEKAHQSNLVEYYFEQLTGFNGTFTAEMAFKIKVKDGRELYKLSLNEALGLVATPEGLQFVKDSKALSSSRYVGDISNIDYFLRQVSTKNMQESMVLTLKEGMSAIPVTLVKVFLKSSKRNKLTLNRKLEAITQNHDCEYILSLRKTTNYGLTQETRQTESVCAKKVILAIPQFALTKLKWKPLRSPKVKDALFAVTPAKLSKVFLAFPKPWWLNGQDKNTYTVISDAPFRQTYNWKSSHVSGDYVLLSSYADGNITEYLQSLNSNCKLARGSVAGFNKVTDRLKQELLRDIVQAYGIDARLIPESTAAISQFWTSYPFGGGRTNWRAGNNFTDVLQTIQRPSMDDEVYVVGADLSFIGKTAWVESALVTVDLVYNKYFI